MTNNQIIISPRPAPLQATSSSQRMNVSDLSATASRTGRSQLALDFQPSLFSVICGRGKDSYDHAGNHHFRELANMFVARYSRAGSKIEKSKIVSEMVAMIHQADGTFCKYENGAWFQVGDQCAREKASALLRGILYKRRSFAKAKAQAKLFCRRTSTDLPVKENNTTQKTHLVEEDGIGCGYDSEDDSSISSSLSCWGSSSKKDPLLGELELGNYSLESEDDFFDVFQMDSMLQLHNATTLTASTDAAECIALSSKSS
jgi:hypothetical protein